jgi:hypothetical protein
MGSYVEWHDLNVHDFLVSYSIFTCHGSESPPQARRAGAQNGIYSRLWGPWSSDLHLPTCQPAIAILSLRNRGSLLGGQNLTASYRIIRHVVNQRASC